MSAVRPTQALLSILRQQGSATITPKNKLWELVQKDATLQESVRSKLHMKTLVNWLKDHSMVQTIKEGKKFGYRAVDRSSTSTTGSSSATSAARQ